MPRRTISGAAATGLLLTTLIGGAPAAQAHPTYHPWGKVFSADHTLKRGCHNYKYSYVVDPPSNRWAAEIFFVNPNGRALASYAIDSASDPKRGNLRVRVCRPSTVYGTHKLKMKITWQRDREITDGYVRPTTFRFTRPAR